MRLRVLSGFNYYMVVAIMALVFSALCLVFIGSGLQVLKTNRSLGILRIVLGIVVGLAGFAATWFYLSR